MKRESEHLRQAGQVWGSILAVAGLVAVMLVSLTATAEAAVDARLEGDVNVDFKTVRFDPSPSYAGTKEKRRVFTFTPTCASGACDRIKLERRLLVGSISHVLQRTAKGVWQGTAPNPQLWYGCKGGTKWGETTETMKVTVLNTYKSGPKAGLAKRIKLELTINYSKFTAARAKTSCGKSYKKLGLKAGQIPIGRALAITTF